LGRPFLQSAKRFRGAQGLNYGRSRRPRAKPPGKTRANLTTGVSVDPLWGPPFGFPSPPPFARGSSVPHRNFGTTPRTWKERSCGTGQPRKKPKKNRGGNFLKKLVATGKAIFHIPLLWTLCGMRLAIARGLARPDTRTRETSRPPVDGYATG
jgi:hypothetical protein